MKTSTSFLQSFRKAIGEGSSDLLVSGRVLTNLLDDLDELSAKLRASNPCCSCGCDPSVTPSVDEELPIVRGALDAQADVETRLFATRPAIEHHRLLSILLDAGCSVEIHPYRHHEPGFHVIGPDCRGHGDTLTDAYADYQRERSRVEGKHGS